ncbi:dihydrofolate reductase family protein [Flavobacterium foetidum]|uniref:dihydrofolate reductase family protein n=1 Tax=Flavobacterium foetidum TaxID=2026681 RepID=UPI00107571EE|nr:dihydrofolate reductase family protein [Flavobacterium foetidum]KAF2516467.1 dihydrofolate reductase family protein [Flavobacterium foetidum]
MRKLKLQMNITIDGFVGGENGELDWMLQETDTKHIEYLNSITENTDMILLGRNMAQISIPHWQKASENTSENSETDFAKFFTETLKVVFSKTLKNIEGKNTVLENGNLKHAVEQLKTQSGLDIMVYGGAQFVSSLISENLIDELNLFVHPVSLGKGLPIFKSESKYKLAKAAFYSNGIVLHKYVKS